MPYEVAILGWTVLLSFAYFVVMAVVVNLDVGVSNTFGARDRPLATSATSGRLRRALDNQFDAMVLFTAAVAFVTLADASTPFTQWMALIFLASRIAYMPAYASGIFGLRSVIWWFGFAASVAMVLPALLSTAHAQSGPSGCSQGSAIYTDADKGWTLTFDTPADGLGIASNHFELVSIARPDVSLEGWVIWDGEPEAPMADLLDDCPVGDATGEEMDACRVWRGPVYTLRETGIDWLDEPDSPAAPALLLPLLAQAVKRADVGGDSLTKLPWDAFALTGCRKE